jgi:hypothetical protein
MPNPFYIMSDIMRMPFWLIAARFGCTEPATIHKAFRRIKQNRGYYRANGGSLTHGAERTGIKSTLDTSRPPCLSFTTIKRAKLSLRSCSTAPPTIKTTSDLETINVLILIFVDGAA